MKKKSCELIEEFSETAKLLSKYQLWYYRKFGPSGDPHRGQGRVLKILKLQPEISQKELGYLLDMRNQSLGELLVKLEKSGAITREPSEEDRRSMNIRLTAVGAELVSSGGGKTDDAGEIFECLSTEDREKLREILSSLSIALKNVLGYNDAHDGLKPESQSDSHHRRNQSGDLNKNLSSEDLNHKEEQEKALRHSSRKEAPLK